MSKILGIASLVICFVLVVGTSGIYLVQIYDIYSSGQFTILGSNAYLNSIHLSFYTFLAIIGMVAGFSYVLIRVSE